MLSKSNEDPRQSDGDSKSYNAVVDMDVYSPGKKVEKEDCLNHISKRMGTALQKLMANSRIQGESLSGKDKLTQFKIIMVG